MQRLGQMLDDAKYTVGHMQFFPGITGGINATFFGPTTLGGFQLGASGEFVFNERWSVMARTEIL